jgi:hypothetical protein
MRGNSLTTKQDELDPEGEFPFKPKAENFKDHTVDREENRSAAYKHFISFSQEF